MEQRVRKLEERMASFEERLVRKESPALVYNQSPELKKMARIAVRHMQEERENFNAWDVANAEELYRRSEQLYMKSANGSKVMLDSLVMVHAKLNRAGCARLYRAQQEMGKEQERLLKDCITKFSGCYYGDGTQAWQLGMLLLAANYQLTGNEKEAHKLYRKLRKEYSESTGNDGELLVDKI